MRRYLVDRALMAHQNLNHPIEEFAEHFKPNFWALLG
jgi:hypothetical protein